MLHRELGADLRTGVAAIEIEALEAERVCEADRGIDVVADLEILARRRRRVAVAEHVGCECETRGAEGLEHRLVRAARPRSRMSEIQRQRRTALAEPLAAGAAVVHQALLQPRKAAVEQDATANGRRGGARSVRGTGHQRRLRGDRGCRREREQVAA